MDGMMMMMMIFFHIFGLFSLPAVIACSQISSRTLRNQDPTKHKNWHLLNNDGYCGVSHNQRIIGGVDAGLGKYPWIVRLGFIYEGDDVLLKCAGSIINTKYVLTANHCFQPNDELGFVRAGEYDERTNPDCEDDVCAPEYIDFNVEKIINHKEYRDGVSFVNDITLIRIEGEFEFDDYIMPICFEYGSLLKNDYVGSDVEVAGWGIYDAVKEVTHPVLQTVTVPVLDSEVCVRKMRKATTVNPSKQICAGGEIGKDSCGGDSGGPLMSAQAIDDMPPRYFIVGLVSFGVKMCGMSTMPAVYTRVSSYLQWILDNIRR